MFQVLKELAQAAIDGARQAPRDFFAPVIGFARWVRRQLDASVAETLRHAAESKSTHR